MNVPAAALDLVKKWEGRRLTAYTCPAGVLTIGYGSTGAHVRRGMTITEAEAEDLLRNELVRFVAAVDGSVTVPLNDNQRGALISFAFNVGVGAFKASTLLKKLNAGGYDDVPEQLRRWTKGGGKVLPGLVNRREDEVRVWSTPVAAPAVQPAEVSPAARIPANDNNPASLGWLAEALRRLFVRR